MVGFGGWWFISQSYYTQRLVTNGAPQGSLTGPELLTTIISNPKQMAECTLIKCGHDSKLRGTS